mmetsp:Transcript_7610/g.16569  ORF Transcript_7610/g.16569 Transcript_7610/m.16569 type:complete len:395 (-) Transcript_7610:165-1349(-)
MLDRLQRFEQLTKELKTPKVSTKSRQQVVDPFFVRDAAAQKCLQAMKSDLLRLQKLTDEAVKASVPTKEAKIAKEFMCMLDTIQSRIPQTKQILSEMDVLARDAEDCEKDTSTTRIMVYRNVIAATTRSFKGVVQSTMNAEAAYRDALAKKLARQLKYAYPDMKEEDIQQLASDPEAASAALSSRLSGGNEDLEGVLLDLKAKHSDLQKLETSVVELAEVFTYFAALVDMQGELIDSIDAHVAQAREQTEQAVAELHSAQNWQRKYLNMKFTFLLVVLVVVIGALLWILDSAHVFRHVVPISVDPSTPVQRPPPPHTHAPETSVASEISDLEISPLAHHTYVAAGQYRAAEPVSTRHKTSGKHHHGKLLRMQDSFEILAPWPSGSDAWQMTWRS